MESMGAKSVRAKRKEMLSEVSAENTLLCEAAWEVCNQVGGIYTVIRSKVPSMVKKWGDNYCVIGPYVHKDVEVEFEERQDLSDSYGIAVRRMRDMGIEVHYGHWLITGRPKAILFNPQSVNWRLGQIKYELWSHHNIPCPHQDGLIDPVIAFGELMRIFFRELCDVNNGEKRIIGHFHEWMAGTTIPSIRKEELPMTTIFTTHATMLGRYLAMNDPMFYEHLPFLDWQKEAQHFNIETQVRIERAAAHGSHVFSTVSEVTANECTALVGRSPDIILPNGLNIERFTAMHEFQNLHRDYKKKISRFVMGHFFPSYSFDLDKTLFFFTSGRYEYRNKGFDLTLEALARLNHRMHQEGIDKTVVMFFVTKRPYQTINPFSLQSRSDLTELRLTCKAIEKQIGERLFLDVTQRQDGQFPDLEAVVDQHLRLKLKRLQQGWKTKSLPPVVTHYMTPEAENEDEILPFLRNSGMINKKDDKVKIVYHPDFISGQSPLFRMEYDHFVRGCHLGIFPSYYEPWGYTPLECAARGIPNITSDLSGFGDYVLKVMPESQDKGIYVIKRKNRSFDEAANQLAECMLSFVRMGRRDRITQRNVLENLSDGFDWSYLTRYYDQAYSMAAERGKK